MNNNDNINLEDNLNNSNHVVNIDKCDGTLYAEEAERLYNDSTEEEKEKIDKIRKELYDLLYTEEEKKVEK